MPFIATGLRKGDLFANASAEAQSITPPDFARKAAQALVSPTSDLMKNLLTTLLLATLPGISIACPHNLSGTWQPDQEPTTTFIRNNSRLEPHTEAFLATLFGHMTLTFSARELHVVMPDIEISVSGVQKPFAGFEERKPCTVLHCSKSAVVWSAKQFFGTEPGATTFHFVDTDTFWLYAGSTDPKVPDLHVREFFRRVR